jgi:hypothetical protein
MNTVTNRSAIANTRLLVFSCAAHLLNCVTTLPIVALFYQTAIMEEVYKGHRLHSIVPNFWA